MENYLTLRNNTQLYSPSGNKYLGVVGDSSARVLTFKFDRWPSKKFDLGRADIFVIYENEDQTVKAKDYISASDITITEDQVTFDWLPKSSVFKEAGTVQVKVTANIKENQKVTQSWNTEAIAMKVAESLPDYEINSDQEESVYMITESDFMTESEAASIVDSVYAEAVEGAS